MEGEEKGIEGFSSFLEKRERKGESEMWKSKRKNENVPIEKAHDHVEPC